MPSSTEDHEARQLSGKVGPQNDRESAGLNSALGGRLEEKQTRPQAENAATQYVSQALAGRSQQSKSATQLRSKFYSDAFAYREPPASEKEQLACESSVIAEVKTNVIVSETPPFPITGSTETDYLYRHQVKDEHTFMTEFSDHLAQRFQRPTSAIVLNLVHSACLMYGGSFDPAYILTISALPTYVQASTNKRNAALIQGFLARALKVVESRGAVRFCAIAEDSFATNGMTISGRLENLAKSYVKDLTAENRRTEKRAGKRQHPQIPEETELKLMSSSERNSGNNKVPALFPPIPSLPPAKSTSDKQAARVQRLGKRRSFRQLIGI
ncbi:hypothetical protein MMC13_004778 [Lambiella insularis]|nr:hypothetical protein [Lambiella insularis]